MIASEQATVHYKAELITALDAAIAQGLLTETAEVTAYREYVNAISDSADASDVTWPRKLYPFEVTQENKDVTTGSDNEKYHCKNRDYIAHPFKTLPTDPSDP